MTRLVWRMSTLAITLLLATVARPAMSITPTGPPCAVVVEDLSPCLSFIQGKSATPACCEGVKGLAAMARGKADLVAICNCGKLALGTITYDPNRIPLLPKQCGVNINLPPIDKNTDCNKIGLKGLLNAANGRMH
ncbi:hypothetical protein RJ639_041617 [Escallonia herrerae]|uniref:Non-specific lipid-transfer protein n=1 Tax=Escallonia herrerae TaxID=1293975 RepID=A0AA89B6Q8_9ASTE|nr:hypothetical protein RJ639_041617 [Escallonia herrerae]